MIRKGFRTQSSIMSNVPTTPTSLAPSVLPVMLPVSVVMEQGLLSVLHAHIILLMWMGLVLLVQLVVLQLIPPLVYSDNAQRSVTLPLVIAMVNSLVIQQHSVTQPHVRSQQGISALTITPSHKPVKHFQHLVLNPSKHLQGIISSSSSQGRSTFPQDWMHWTLT